MFGRDKREMAKAADMASAASIMLDAALTEAEHGLRELAELPQLHRFPAVYREQIVNDFTRKFASVKGDAEKAMAGYLDLAKDIPHVTASKDRNLRKEFLLNLMQSAVLLYDLTKSMDSLAETVGSLSETVFQKLADCDSARAETMQRVNAAREILDLAGRYGHDVSAGRRELDELVSGAPVLTQGSIYEGWSQALKDVTAGAERIQAEAGALLNRR